MPEISVIIPTYNCAKYITDAVDSVLNQTYKDFEIIVVDDGSTDSTKEELSNYISSKKVKYYYQMNSGVAAARNKGIGEAKGELIAFLDADDRWLPERLEKSTEFLRIYNFDWVCSAYYRQIRETGGTATKGLDNENLSDNSLNINMLKETKPYFLGNPIFTGTVLVRRKTQEEVGKFDEYCQPAEDWDMWLRYEEAGLRGGYLNIPLAYYMKTRNSLTTSRKYKMISSDLAVAIKHSKILGLHNRKVRNSLGLFYFKKADTYYNEHDAYIRSFYLVLMGFFYFPSIKMILKGFRVLFKRNNLRKNIDNK